MTLTKTISERAFTSGLSDSHVTKLAELAHEVSFREDEIILVAGDGLGALKFQPNPLPVDQNES